MRAQLNSSTSPVRAEIRPGIWLDSRLALWIGAQRLLVIADPHWGFAASHRARGNLLPWWGDDEIETQLDSLVTAYQPAEMLWLGDVVHAAAGSARAEAYLRASRVPVTLLAGNHDRCWPTARERSSRRENFFFHHGDGAPVIPAGALEIVGHHHPAVSWGDAAGSRLKLPALIASPTRLILPAFSPWAAGTPWNDRLGAEDTGWVIAPHRIFALPRRTPSLSAVL